MTYTKIQGILTILVLIIDAVWIGSSSFLLHYNGLDLIVFAGMFILFWRFYFSYKEEDPQPKLITALQSILLLLLYTKFTLVLSYLAYTTNYPLINSTLASLDSSLGFESETLFFWFQAHPWWNKFFTLIYDTSKPQILLIIVYFSFFGNPIYLQRFIMLFMLSIPLTIFIGCLCPAVGTYAWYHYAADETQIKVFHHFSELRQHVLNIEIQNGIVEFPSFHTTLALMFAYTFRHERKLIFIPILLLNGLMIFSCLSQGGHYLVDILGGVAVFAVVAGIEKWLFLKVFLTPKQQIDGVDKKKIARYKHTLTDKLKIKVHG